MPFKEDLDLPSVPAPPIGFGGALDSPFDMNTFFWRGPGGTRIAEEAGHGRDAETSALRNRITIGSQTSAPILMHELGHVSQFRKGDETLESTVKNFGDMILRGGNPLNTDDTYGPEGVRHEVGHAGTGQLSAPEEGLEFLRNQAEAGDKTAESMLRTNPNLSRMKMPELPEDPSRQNGAQERFGEFLRDLFSRNGRLGEASPGPPGMIRG